MSGNTSTGDTKTYAIVAGAVLALIFVPMLVVDHSSGRSSTKASDVNTKDLLTDAEREVITARIRARTSDDRVRDFQENRAKFLEKLRGPMSSPSTSTKTEEEIKANNDALFKAHGIE